VDHLPVMLRTIYDSSHTYAVHYDMKIGDEVYVDKVADLKRQFPYLNVFLLERGPITYR
jgi:hypothetical protein